jgi:hypothetical protein
VFTFIVFTRGYDHPGTFHGYAIIEIVRSLHHKGHDNIDRRNNGPSLKKIPFLFKDQHDKHYHQRDKRDSQNEGREYSLIQDKSINDKQRHGDT